MCTTKSQFMSQLTFPLTTAPKYVHPHTHIYLPHACRGAIASMPDVQIGTCMRTYVDYKHMKFFPRVTCCTSRTTYLLHSRTVIMGYFDAMQLAGLGEMWVADNALSWLSFSLGKNGLLWNNTPGNIPAIEWEFRDCAPILWRGTGVRQHVTSVALETNSFNLHKLCPTISPITFLGLYILGHSWWKV